MTRDSNPIIYLITKGEATDANFDIERESILSIVKAAVEHEVQYIQIREKRLSARLLFELTVSVVKAARGSRTRILVNDRADIALGAKADGVHLTANSLRTDAVRSYFPRNFIIGVSTHSLDAANAAFVQGADFVVFGPVFETPGKGEPKGLEELRVVCEKLDPFPVIGLGGIDETNVKAVINAGARGIGAIRALNDLDSLMSITRISDCNL